MRCAIKEQKKYCRDSAEENGILFLESVSFFLFVFLSPLKELGLGAAHHTPTLQAAQEDGSHQSLHGADH